MFKLGAAANMDNKDHFPGFSKREGTQPSSKYVLKANISDRTKIQSEHTTHIQITVLH
jgi:hypothetical protein